MDLNESIRSLEIKEIQQDNLNVNNEKNTGNKMSI